MSPTDGREVRAYVTVLIGRTMLPLSLGVLLAVDLGIRLGPGRAAVAALGGVGFAAAVAWPVSRAFPGGLRRSRWLLARAVRRHPRECRRSLQDWPAHSAAWELHDRLLSEWRAHRPPPAESATVVHRRAAVLEARRRIIAVGGEGACDPSCRKGRARVKAYSHVIEEVRHPRHPGEHDELARAFIAEFPVPAAARHLSPMARRLVGDQLRQRWAAGERSEDLTDALLSVTDRAESVAVLQSAVDAGLPYRRDLLEAAWRAGAEPLLGPADQEAVARAGLRTEPRIIQNLMLILARQNRHTEALAVARSEAERGNRHAVFEVTRAERRLAWAKEQAEGHRARAPHRAGGDPPRAPESFDQSDSLYMINYGVILGSAHDGGGSGGDGGGDGGGGGGDGGGG